MNLPAQRMRQSSAFRKWQDIAGKSSVMGVRFLLAVVCGAFYARQLYAGRNGKNNARQDSEIMIKVLEERVNAVNRWDE